MTKVTFNESTIKTGAAMLADGRHETAWLFYEAAAAAIPATLEGKTLTAVLDTLRDKLVAKRFGKVNLTAEEAKRSKVPSVGTMKKRITDVRPTIGADVDRSVSLETFGHVYRSPDAAKDLEKANKLIEDFRAANGGNAPSVREARDGFGREPKVKTGAASDGGPATVADMIEYLIGQPKAVANYVAEYPDVAATLAAMLAPMAEEAAA